MQDRYAGDVGDFGKFALLRALAPGRKLGVCWYFCTGKGETTKDGRHTKYLQQRDRFRDLDAEVFDAMGKLVQGERSADGLERTALLTDPCWHRKPVPRRNARSEWFQETKQAVETCDLVFADPDNGISETPTPKHIGVTEIHDLRRPGRALLIYKHQGRTKGGAKIEACKIARLVDIDQVDVIRLRPYSPRFYFLFDADDSLRARLHAFAKQWEKEAELIDVRCPPPGR